MVTRVAANLGPGSNHAWERLLVAFGLSLFLHLALMLGIPVNPTGGLPSVTSMINARLEPASDTPSVTSGDPPLPDVAPNVVSEKPALTDPLAEPAERKPEPEPQPKAPSAPAPSPSAGIQVPLIRDPTYYPAKQLDVYPRLMAEVEKKCPPAADANRINGEVLILLLIDEFGVVNDASIIEAKPEGYFEEYTLSLFRPARFLPAEKQGRAVKSRAPIRVRFICGDVESAPR